jgi:hypothetical protein
LKISIKRLLIVIVLALFAFLAGVVWWASRRAAPEDIFAENNLDSYRSPSFEFRVVVPRLARPFGGILPDWVVRKLDATPGELHFNHADRGAYIERVGPDRVELKSDDWDFYLEADAAGRVTSSTRFVFPLALGGRHVRLQCRPAEPPNGALNTTKRTGSDVLGGRFVVELAHCENADSGKPIEWPASPLTVSGSFIGRSQQTSPGSN